MFRIIFSLDVFTFETAKNKKIYEKTGVLVYPNGEKLIVCSEKNDIFLEGSILK